MQFSVLVLFALVGCSTAPTVGDGVGSIQGVVTAADGTTPIASATVYVESRGPTNGATTSNVQGAYTLTNVPSGQQVVVATKGNFKSTTPITVSGTRPTQAPVSKLIPNGKLGYVSGSFDSIEQIVQSLGYSADLLSTSQLNSASALQSYKVIFLNCGAGVSTSAAANLKAWVAAGGTLYASDWEVDVVRAMFPNDVITIGSGNTQTVTATIINPALQVFTGKATVSIAYDLPAWRTLKSLSTAPVVLLRATVREGSTSLDQPIAIEILHGSGKVIYTTFHNEAGVTADQIVVLRYFIFS
jgi:hypothetical protein